ncbi:cupredoxin domain-containing protein [Thermogemmatispora onikobensis]|uniref:cupredoxin domain-containing protein n=1 Tax=Thermogemmatispora onikobensis TaxID=732234 RepID=UPI0008534958|nr:plastocyanin/azurin family copper-binding protein [Thermogemmatispora onikobensis]
MEQKPLRLLWLVLTALALVSLLLVACTRPGTTSSTAANANSSGSSSAASSASGGNTVKMDAANFEVSSITIKKGESITLVNTVAVPHIIQNGSWVNGTAKPGIEAGAPKIDVQFSGNDTKQIGPFTTAGTFKLYCTIHQGMNLTVIVK